MTDNGGLTYPLAPYLDGDPLKRYVRYKRRYQKIREYDREHGDGELPRRFEATGYCQRLVMTHGSIEARRAVQQGQLELLSYMTGLTNREVNLSETRTLMRLITELRRPGFMGLFVGHTDNGKTNTALWLALLALIDQQDLVLATNVTTLEWSEAALNERTFFVESKTELKEVCEANDGTIAVIDELSVQANAQTANYDVNEHFYEMITFKSKLDLRFLPIFHRTDVKDSAPAFRQHATYFLEQKREEHELEDDEYSVSFYKEHDDDTGELENEVMEIPVPPLQPDGDYNPDEQATFSISN
ncbi:hypothetical protein C485_18941 [Natrinema altunense JCM 12890]|uniref:Uncharacterized protein n=1 Tax=Natrinema altunense (strain JCM 12890 / CGMCC 1.3731 / AJ2) TaxID=1227494 RepID=L9Z9N8_NATA2|nr:hypothetical protein C485_18941 [Natrinema altunense JCM 12890]